MALLLFFGLLSYWNASIYIFKRMESVCDDRGFEIVCGNRYYFEKNRGHFNFFIEGAVSGNHRHSLSLSICEIRGSAGEFLNRLVNGHGLQSCRDPLASY